MSNTARLCVDCKPLNLKYDCGVHLGFTTKQVATKLNHKNVVTGK